MGGLAIMAVDPGGKTGVACGIFRDDVEDVKSAVRRARKKGALKAWELSGSAEAQAIALAHTWMEFEFKAHVEMRIPRKSVVLVIENFELRQLAADLAPVEVMRGMLAILLNARHAHADARHAEKTDHVVGVVNKQARPFPDKKTDHGENLGTIKYDAGYGSNKFVDEGWLVWQMPSMAMTDVTNERMKRWGAWVSGSEHARDAMRHLLSFLKAKL